jgi:hypothetical protein
MIPTAFINMEVSIHFIHMAFGMLGQYSTIFTNSGPYLSSERFKEWWEQQKVELYVLNPAQHEPNSSSKHLLTPSSNPRFNGELIP